VSVEAAKATLVSGDAKSLDTRALLPTLVSLEREARKKVSVEHLGFMAVNETHRLVNYYQCVLWRLSSSGKIKIQSVSGVSGVDSDSQVVLSLRRLVKILCRSEESTRLRPITNADVPQKLQRDWDEWLPEHGLWCPFVNPQGQLFAGLLITRDTVFRRFEITLLEPLVEAYSHAWTALGAGASTGGARLVQLIGKRSVQIAVLVLLACLSALPIRESALAPGEIIAHQPLIVSAPVRGVVKEFHVRPNEVVTAGRLLFSLDDTEAKSRFEIAEKSLAVAKADYLRATQKSFSDQRSKSELELFKARVEAKQLERDYALALRERTKVHADRDGIAVFADVNDWIGQPVEVGQRILVLADPTRAEIQIWLAVEDGINLEPGSDVKMFLNTDPTSPLKAKIRQTSYEPEKTPEGSLAFRLKAELEPDQPVPRIGMKGTGKVYGEEVSIFYYITRRPLSALRQRLGV